MVAIRETHHRQHLQHDDEEWAQALPFSQNERDVLLGICDVCRKLSKDDPDKLILLHSGKEMVEILISLHMDLTTLIAALLFPFYDEKIFDDSSLKKLTNKEVPVLLKGVTEMAAIGALQENTSDHNSELHVDNLRRMLLAMVDDVRAVVIKLAERIVHLRQVKNADEEVRVLAAKEIANIYAPLANRLGIGQLKWELEDMAFRYLHPAIYMQIAKQLDERRIDRENYINDFVTRFGQMLTDQGIKAEVYGRPKHIYSIWRKMQKKELDFSELFDVRAVRVIAERLQDCYGILGIVHTGWHHIPKEFDDYVANPKPNGYQSIHTVVVGEGGKNIEIQIRTKDMHEDSELGVAAHWKYKEGESAGRSGFEDKIAWLRKLLQWQEDVAESGELVDELRSQVFEERVYVFTPKGEVVDLPSGSTPLDFAYYIHSLVGHRCKGAKVGGRIVPFTYKLQTGDQVDIITQKEPNPSRDWLNPNLGYVSSSRARAKIQTWFKKQDKSGNIIAGRELLEAELARHNFTMKEALKSAERFNVSSLDDLLAGIGGGDIRLNQVINHIQTKLKKPSAEEADIQALQQLEKNIVHPEKRKARGDHIVVEGVGNLMTSVASCCNPLPGEYICGFITQGRGISVHRKDCPQFKNLVRTQPERLIDASWGEHYSGGVALTVRVVANDRSGLLCDITTILANEKVNVLGVSSHSDLKHQMARIDMEVEIYNLENLSRVIARLTQVQDVIEARRL